MKPLFISLTFLFSVCANAQTHSRLDGAKILALSTNKFILIDFTATWCGPCQLMDAQFWSKEEYQNITNRFVVVKIDIDDDKTTALNYSVEAIPNIKIVDAGGEEIHGIIGYRGAEEMGKELAGFPSSAEDLYDAIQFEQKGKPTAEECLFVASSYQTILQKADGAGKEALMKKSNDYFRRCKKTNPPDSIAQKADIGRAFNYILEDAPEKAVKEIQVDKINAENKAFALYILARAYRDMKDKPNAEKYLAMLDDMKDENWRALSASVRKSME